MTNLLWPGDHRAGDLMTDEALLATMVAVESAWLNALVGAGLAPVEAADADLGRLLDAQDCEVLAAGAEDGGNPVTGLVALLRERAAPALSAWIHRGLTSQDVLDTSLMLAARDVADMLKSQLSEQISTLSTLARTYRATPMVARTLTQHAVPTTFGAKVAGWLNSVIDAYRSLDAMTWPAQIGGAGGTLAATTELATLAGHHDGPAHVSIQLAQSTSAALGLANRMPWHTTRTPITALGDALVGCTDAWGRIASDIVTLARPEIAELSEPAAGDRGGSSTMPGKRNPVLSILLRRTAMSAPQLAATLHIAAALAHDERPDGAWHAEWDTLRTLARRTVVAAAQCSELLVGLEIHPGRMAENLDTADVAGEQRAIADLAESTPSPTYFGTVDFLIDDSLNRAQRFLKERR
ncbi:3-carboxy-cis,cis-muconate cycloisomerase [Mycobacterium kyorinense]|uniref:3-carboxy-cis,cis-muconate cycloisomerase n=1 Tax=Mycobacterium kyorinense TaxID=487514 RepID=A0A1A2Z3U8_9MYCO|nr:lyase family protein [Mycobacterium kyorinense]OBI44348.1 3-carboxy-cis,cis-muconate cycloisomerase [Mycobacterium kyorinense]